MEQRRQSSQLQLILNSRRASGSNEKLMVLSKKAGIKQKNIRVISALKSPGNSPRLEQVI